MLFGHQNDDNKQQNSVINDVTAPADPRVNPLAVDPDTGVSLPVAPEDLEHEDGAEATVLNQPHDEPTVSEPVFSAEASDAATETPASDEVPSAPPAASVDNTASSTNDDLLQSTGEDDLLSLKQKALEQLSPLVSHLDQSPEEKFRTTMMMIQSSDNQGLIKDAYEAAQAISDDKVRAQALLDIVNEINYFTQNDK